MANPRKEKRSWFDRVGMLRSKAAVLAFVLLILAMLVTGIVLGIETVRATPDTPSTPEAPSTPTPPGPRPSLPPPPVETTRSYSRDWFVPTAVALPCGLAFMVVAWKTWFAPDPMRRLGYGVLLAGAGAAVVVFLVAIGYGWSTPFRTVYPAGDDPADWVYVLGDVSLVAAITLVFLVISVAITSVFRAKGSRVIDLPDEVRGRLRNSKRGSATSQVLGGEGFSMSGNQAVEVRMNQQYANNMQHGKPLGDALDELGGTDWVDKAGKRMTGVDLLLFPDSGDWMKNFNGDNRRASGASEYSGGQPASESSGSAGFEVAHERSGG